MTHHSSSTPLGVCTPGLYVAPQKVAGSLRDLGGLLQCSGFVICTPEMCEGNTWPLLSTLGSPASPFQAGQESPVTLPSGWGVVNNLRNSLRFQVATIKQEKSYCLQINGPALTSQCQF